MEPRRVAIMAAEFAELGRNQGRVDAETLGALVAICCEESDAAIRENGGRRLYLGQDSAIADFDRTTDALHCALRIQRSVAARSRDRSELVRVPVRIGVHWGKIQVMDDGVIGVAPSLAARLWQEVGPGEICVSGAARDQLPKGARFVFENLGGIDLPFVEESLHAFRLLPGD